LARRAVFSFDELKNLTMGDDGVKANLETCEIALPVASLGLLKSALCALKVLEVVGLDWKRYCENLREFEPPEGRFRPIRWGNWLLIDDTYNANPPSVKNALESLRYFFFSGQKLAVLGDMLELGEYSERLHRQVGEMCAKYGIECWFFGRWMQKAYEECVKAKGNCFRLESEEKLKKRLSEGSGVIIFKGSRGVRMERFIKLITEN
ncbi:MAG: UDP-N-acetylmuramoyl-tripeptide--D-alanyl-D-alanine ligase, partial [Aquificaceae bacterium]|nr:UDP-N-acetylmuramoyl-tripeptide--D-alanyl-D-alanine ligase [Aquificaceae bacterium]MDW8237679.1 cyanophycin synthetase [Aquificaceae bacterium]